MALTLVRLEAGDALKEHLREKTAVGNSAFETTQPKLRGNLTIFCVTKCLRGPLLSLVMCARSLTKC